MIKNICNTKVIFIGIFFLVAIISNITTNNIYSIIFPTTKAVIINHPSPGDITAQVLGGGFNQQNACIIKNSPVTWKNDNAIPLKVGIKDEKSNNRIFKSGELQTNSNFTYTFTNIGNYTYYNSNYMDDNGLITVVDKNDSKLCPQPSERIDSSPVGK